MTSLQELGLTRNEEKIYLALLEAGPSLAGDVAKKSQVHRRNTYDTLKKLLEKGLISYTVKGKSKYYQALNPNRLVDLQKERLNLSQDILPQLLTKFSLSKANQEVITLEGTEGMKTFLQDFADGKSERLMLGATGEANEMLKYFFPRILNKLKNMKPPIKILWSKEAKNRKIIEKQINSINKTLPKKYSSPTQLFIYKDKTAITIWSEKPIIIIITSKEIQSGFKKYFKMLWNST
jgi:HTH-type transcriptional regulator, sugar sensing transcriptional regulator